MDSDARQDSKIKEELSQIEKELKEDRPWLARMDALDGYCGGAIKQDIQFHISRLAFNLTRKESLLDRIAREMNVSKENGR